MLPDGSPNRKRGILQQVGGVGKRLCFVLSVSETRVHVPRLRKHSETGKKTNIDKKYFDLRLLKPPVVVSK